ncbi:MAG: hypothetical protein ACLU4N_00295 [Butyricimonas faecihominis]
MVKADEIKGIPSPTIASLLKDVAGMDGQYVRARVAGNSCYHTRLQLSDVEQGRRFSNPLWVVDGVPLNSFTSGDGTNLLSDINPI